MWLIKLSAALYESLSPKGRDAHPRNSSVIDCGDEGNPLPLYTTLSVSNVASYVE